MRTAPDALRSVRRYVASILPGPPWRTMLAGDPGQVERPYVIVATTDSATVNQSTPDTVRQSLPVIVQAYPWNGRRPSESKMIAEAVADALNQAMIAGVADYADPSVRGYRQRIPLWDFGGVQLLLEDGRLDLDALGLDRTATFRHDPDYLWVADGWRVQSLPAAQEGQLFVAQLEMRVQWFRPSGLRSVGPLLDDVRVHFQP